MGNAAVVLAEYFPAAWGKCLFSTPEPETPRHMKKDGTYDWDAAVTNALEQTGKKEMISRNKMERLITFLQKQPKQGAEKEEWERRWMQKWLKRWKDLTPADMPYYMGKRGRYPYDIFVDGKTFGATNHPWGGSDCPSILEYAMRMDWPSVPMLVQIWD